MENNTIVPGDLVFFTVVYDIWLHKRNPTHHHVMANRLARLEQIIDWDSETGKVIAEARKSHMRSWVGLDPLQCKYIFTVYYPELPGRDGKSGAIACGVPMFAEHPVSKKPFFIPVPEWLSKQLIKPLDQFKAVKAEG